MLVWAALIVCLGVAGSVPAYAADPSPSYFTFYLQQSFPKQTNTNNQIQQINETLGTNFDDWSDVTNLSLGAQFFKRVSPYWKVGVQLDYSQGAIKGTATIPTEAGPAELSFEQKYNTYFDVYAVAHFLPCPSCTKVVPFVYGGIGYGYEKDRTTLNLHNEFINEDLIVVNNDGWFPTYSAGVGIDVPLSSKDKWYLEFGGAYVWARMTNTVPATGSLAPPEVEADTDFTGPNYWIGIGLKF